MKMQFIVLLLATSAFAQTQAKDVKSACGPASVHFDVKLDTGHHSADEPAEGKALVYFLQDTGTANPFGTGSAQVTKVGMDGAWVGANKNDSWFSVAINPGEHHLCVNAQSRLFGHVMEFAHFTAEAGHVYFFRTRNFMWQSRRLEFGPADRDQALYMIESYPLSISHPNK